MGDVTVGQVILVVFGLIQIAIGWLINKIFQEIKEAKTHAAVLYEKVSAAREMILQQRIDWYKDQLEQCRKGGDLPHA